VQLNPLTGLLPATIGLAVATLYLTGTVRLHGSRRPWPRLRTASFLAAVATISAGFLLPGFLGASVHDPRVAMTTHLLTGMVGPLLIALSAPVMLALRALGPRGRRRLTAVLGRPWVRFLGHPMTATVLSVGGVYVLYLTPLYARVHDAAVLGLLVHAHVVVAAALVAWAIVGVDHVPHRPSMRVRGAALVLVVLLHTVLSRLLFADADRLAAEAGGTAGEWRAAAELTCGSRAT
jgi:putative membrane protein